MTKKPAPPPKPPASSVATRPGGRFGVIENSQKPVGETTNTVNTKPVHKP